MESLAQKYPKYYKELPAGVKPDEIDTYVVNRMFPVDDPTGTILHARKKLLIPGVRSGGKSMLKDIIEARDTLNRYIALMDEIVKPVVAEPEVVLETEGWHPHLDFEVPRGLRLNDVVSVRMANEHEVAIPRPVSEWAWDYSGTNRITHYRVHQLS